jgi:ATP-dependent helicase STH1/SNF2
VLASLPSKEERVVRCPLSALQVRLYHLLQDGCQAAAAAHKAGGLGSSVKQPLSTANLLMQLRKLCCHPFLLVQDLLEWEEELAPCLVSACGKLLVLARLLTRLKVKRIHRN